MSDLNLANLQINKKAKKKAKRVGRGNASGHGTYSTRGLKGQRSRSGGKKGLKRFGLKQLLRNKPKIGGFRSLKPRFQSVNLTDLEKHFEAQELINPAKLVNKGLVDSPKRIKILGTGKLTKKFTVVADGFSESAKKAIIEAGGQAQIRVYRAKKVAVKK